MANREPQLNRIGCSQFDLNLFREAQAQASLKVCQLTCNMFEIRLRHNLIKSNIIYWRMKMINVLERESCNKFNSESTNTGFGIRRHILPNSKLVRNSTFATYASRLVLLIDRVKPNTARVYKLDSLNSPIDASPLFAAT